MWSKSWMRQIFFSKLNCSYILSLYFLSLNNFFLFFLPVWQVIYYSAYWPWERKAILVSIYHIVIFTCSYILYTLSFTKSIDIKTEPLARIQNEGLRRQADNCTIEVNTTRKIYIECLNQFKKYWCNCWN